MAHAHNHGYVSKASAQSSSVLGLRSSHQEVAKWLTAVARKHDYRTRGSELTVPNETHPTLCDYW